MAQKKKKKSFGLTLAKCGAIGAAIGSGVGKLVTKGLKSANTNPYKNWNSKK